MRSERRYGLIETELQDRKRIDLVFAAGQGATGVISEVDRLDVQLRTVLNDDLARVGERLRRDVERPGRRGRVDRAAVDDDRTEASVTQRTCAVDVVYLRVGPEGQRAAGAGFDAGVAKIDLVIESVV